MINRKHRVIAAFLLCAMLFSVLAVPIGYSKDKQPSKSAILWAALTVLLDILDVYDILIGVIIKDLETMQDRLAEINDELKDKWYLKRKAKEEELKKEQKKLDDLNAEREAAKSKKRDAEARIKTLKSEIRQTEASLKMLSPGEEAERAGLEAQLAMQKSSLASAKQEVKEANKIINSNWRAMKRSYYEWIIGDAFSGLTGELCDIKGRINTLERQADILRREISKKTTEEENETTRRAGVQRDVDNTRREYNEQKKKEEQEAQNER